MNSINKEEKLIDDFYQTNIVSLLEKNFFKKDAFFPLNFESGKDSYFYDRENEEMYLTDIAEDDIMEKLKILNENIGSIDGFVKELLKFAKTIRKEEAEDDISPFIYAMF